MSMYLPNPDIRPTGFEPAEFLEVPPMADETGDPEEVRAVTLPDASRTPEGGDADRY